MSDSRDHMGRFISGHKGAPGQTPRAAITNAIRRQMDPEAIASFLINLVNDPTARVGDRIEAARMILDRTEGKPLATSQSLNVRVDGTGRPELPGNWSVMGPDERRAWIRSLKSGNP